MPDHADWQAATREHLALTHRHSNVQRGADCLARLLKSISVGTPVREAIAREAGDWFSSKNAHYYLA